MDWWTKTGKSDGPVGIIFLRRWDCSWGNLPVADTPYNFSCGWELSMFRMSKRVDPMACFFKKYALVEFSRILYYENQLLALVVQTQQKQLRDGSVIPVSPWVSMPKKVNFPSHLGEQTWENCIDLLKWSRTASNGSLQPRYAARDFQKDAIDWVEPPNNLNLFGQNCRKERQVATGLNRYTMLNLSIWGRKLEDSSNHQRAETSPQNPQGFDVSFLANSQKSSASLVWFPTYQVDSVLHSFGA